MKDLLLQTCAKEKDERVRRNRSREFLQHLILKLISDLGYFQYYTFVGGTALRVVHDVPRFSEDIDLSLAKKSTDFRTFAERLINGLSDYGFQMTHSVSPKLIINRLSIRFPGLPCELGLSPHPTGNLSVNIELDTNPPSGFSQELKLIKKDFIFAVSIMDIPSLYANKVAALLFRKYTKGRDFYDFMWFVTSGAKINPTVFSNAYYQIHGQRVSMALQEIRSMMSEKLSEQNWDDVRKDMAPFLEWPEEINLFREDLFLGLVDEIQMSTP